MKKYILSFIFLLLGTLVSSAQDQLAKQCFDLTDWCGPTTICHVYSECPGCGCDDCIMPAEPPCETIYPNCANTYCFYPRQTIKCGGPGHNEEIPNSITFGCPGWLSYTWYYTDNTFTYEHTEDIPLGGITIHIHIDGEGGISITSSQ